MFADELDIPWLPEVVCAWLPKGTQVEVMTLGADAKHDLAGALEVRTGTVHHALGPRNTSALFRELWQRLDEASAAPYHQRSYVVMDNDQIQKAKAVAQWLATHPRFARLFLPPYGPRANPLERVLGDVHDLCTRNHTRTRLRELVADVVEHLHVNGPWKYKRSDIDHAPAVSDAVSKMAREPSLATAS